MWLTPEEVFDTLRMIESEHLDVRTVTLGISLADCAGEGMRSTCERAVRKILTVAGNLVPTVEQVSREFGVPVVHKRLATSPVSFLGAASGASSYVPLARALDRAAAEVGVDYIGGFSALVHKGIKPCDRILLDSLPEALNSTDRVCSSISVASTRAGINMEAVLAFARALHATAHRRPELQGLPCTRLVAFCNLPEDNPFVAGAVHGPGEGEAAVNVGVSGPGVVRAVVEQCPGADLSELAQAIQGAAFKITRVGEVVGREVARRLGVPFGIVDLSLAPTPARGDSVAEVLEAMGLARCGTHGTTAALALLNDAVKKGGAMATARAGGLSGAFIPVSEDAGMARAVEEGALGLDKLEALTAVCSVGMDMIALPGDTPVETLAAILADEMAIGVMNHKTTAVRLIPVPGKGPGERVEYGGLLGAAPVIPVSTPSPARFVLRGGRIPPPLHSLRN